MGIFATAGKAIASAIGSFGALGAAKPTPNTRPNGGDDVQAYGGFLQSSESNPLLTGQLKWVTYGNATNTAIVATGLRRTLDMLAGTEWHPEPNEYGGLDAQRGVDIIKRGLLDAQLPKPWPTVVRKTALYRYFGFALHEWCAARSDAANQVVFTDIAHRPQHSIDGWDKPSEQMPWQAVRQLTRAGNRFVIPRSRLFYAVDDSLTDSPDGVGLLRHVVELVRRLGIYEGLEGLAYQTDLRGMPSATAPIAELVNAAKADGATTRDQIQAFVETRLQNLTNLVSSYAKTPDQLMYLLLDSAPYLNVDQSTVSQVKKWSLELMKGQSNGVAEVANAIGRVQLEIARVLGIEFVLVGGNNSAGSHGMHSDKTRFFAQNLQTILTEIATFATNDLARTLIGLNGLDPETATPRLVAEPLSLEAVLETCQSLSELAKAGLAADDEAIPVLRARMHLPDAPEPTVDAMGLLGRSSRPGPIPPGIGAPPGVAPAKPAAPGSTPATTGTPGDAPKDLGPRPDAKRATLPGARLR